MSESLTLKRPRSFEEIQLNPRPNPPPPPPINKGTTNIFFKTRMCAKFKVGMCRNGEGCNFAHGVEDLRQPPPNWQELVGAPREDNDHRTSSDNNWDDDQKIIHKMKLCKKFYNGEECPYGDRCNFLHEERAKFRDDSWRFRETSAICIGTTTTTTTPSTNQPEAPPPIRNNVVNVGVGVGGGGGGGGGLDPRLFIMKPAYWKTKLCTKWEITGLCPFGDKCHFAHGLAELQAHGGRIEGEATSMAPPQQLIINEMCCISAAAVEEKQAAKRTLLKWKGPKKINQVYADWLDDIPLVHNMPHNSEI